MASIKFGPAGLGSAATAEKTLEKYHELGFKACEIAFTYGIYIKESQTKPIKAAAEKYNISLSIHSPYWINLNSADKKKVEQSKTRILKCCKIGHLIGAKKIVFHPGYYGKMEKEQTYGNIKDTLLDLQKQIKNNKWDVSLCPETTGKVNVFGSIEEIKQLVKDTKCEFTIDFAHLWARSQGKMTYKEMLEPFKRFKNLHCHFSGIDFGPKGEKNHKPVDKEKLAELIKQILTTNHNVTIISESPEPVYDSSLGLKIMEGLRRKSSFVPVKDVLERAKAKRQKSNSKNN